jgi:hypothetical protein
VQASRLGEQLFVLGPVHAECPGDARLGCETCERVRPLFSHEAEPDLAIVQDEGDFARVQFRVDGYRDEPGVPDREQELQVLHAVAHHECHAIAGYDPRPRQQAAGETRHATLQLCVCEREFVADRHRRPVAEAVRRVVQQDGEIHGCGPGALLAPSGSGLIARAR